LCSVHIKANTVHENGLRKLTSTASNQREWNSTTSLKSHRYS